MRIQFLQRFFGPFAIAVILSSDAATPIAATAIYRCEVGGVTTFSDRPCSAEAAEYVPDAQRVSTVNVERASDPSRPRPEPRSKGRAHAKGSIASDQLKLKEECARIVRSLQEIRSKMRAGYDAREGERLKDRQRKLTLDKREKKCR